MAWRAYLSSESFDFKNITKEMVRLGFLVRLPFRLNLGELYRQNFHFRGKYFEIVLRNKFRIPEGVEFSKVISAVGKDIEKLFTEAIIVVRNPKISKDFLESLQRYDPGKSDFPLIESGVSIGDAIEALNHFISAYANATNQVIGIRLFNFYDFYEILRCEITIYFLPHEELTDDDYKEAFDFRPEMEFIFKTININPELKEFTIAEVAKVKESISDYLKKQEDFIHYKLAFEAKAKMFAGDNIGALLLAAALEGAHSAFVQNELRSRLHGEIKASLIDDFIRELGMSLCNQLTPFLLLSEEERPDVDLIHKAERGLKYRNEIMHLLRNQKGEYRIRTRSNREINEAYSAVLKTYDYYIRALENRFKKAPYN
jgi:hypothetical protein